MKRLITSIGVASMIAISGCASSGMGAGYSPVVDPYTSHNPQNYGRDLADCQALASRVQGGGESALKQGLVGGGVGAALGAAVGAITGNVGAGASMGAAIGGIGGVGKGAVEGTENQEMAVRECMRGRGHAVIGR